MTNTPDPADTRPMRERMEAGDLYIADAELAVANRAAYGLSLRYAARFADDPDEARRILQQLLGSIADDAMIKPPLAVDYGRYITVGAGTFINSGLVALDVARITIGCDVQIGPNVQLLTPTHPVEPGLRRAKWEAAAPIVLEDNVWLGGGAIVLAGVTVGRNAVVGAGAVVTRDVPANTVVVGNPARVIRTFDPQDEPRPSA